jgi:hypothetical protein
MLSHLKNNRKNTSIEREEPFIEYRIQQHLIVVHVHVRTHVCICICICI